MAIPERSLGAGRGDRPRGSFGLLAMLLVIVGGIVTLFTLGFKDAAVYSIPVDRLLATGETARRVRIDGELVPGTLVKRDKPCEYRFSIRGETRVLEIRFPQCVVPDTFRDVPEGGVMVTAEGKLTSDGHFEATLILAKCSSKYDPKTHAMQLDEKSATAAPGEVPARRVPAPEAPLVR
ncbi:MAG: cytochrome c maturation protein CcmE [Myxococcales bacterium]|nr:cytochrome c maturation protein CcmE [Myxococcales bacterium]